MNDFDFSDVEKRFSVAMRPFPAMAQTKKAADRVIALWDGVVRDTGVRALPRIWDKIVEARGEPKLRSSEWTYVPNILFADCDEGRRKLCVFPEICAELFRTCLKGPKDDRFLQGLLFDFFLEYPPEALESSVLKAFQAIFMQASNEKYRSLFTLNFLGKDAVRHVAGQIPATMTVSDFLKRRPEVSPEGKFAQRVWLEATSRYERFLSNHLPNKPIKEALDFLRRDFDGILLNQSSTIPRVRLAKAVLQWFYENSHIVPENDDQEELFRFFSYILGDRNDQRYAERWDCIPPRLLHLFDFWALGRQLNGAFDAVEKGLESPDARVAWRERKFYWLRYWRIGRIRQVHLFAPRNQMTALQTTLRHNGFPLPVGSISGRSGQSIMLLIALDDDLTAFEFSHNGSLRFIKNLPPALLKGRSWNFDVIQSRSTASIRHSTYWQGRADATIEELTGKRRPPL